MREIMTSIDKNSRLYTSLFMLIIGTSFALKTLKDRHKRQTVENYIIDSRMVVDSIALQRFENRESGNDAEKKEKAQTTMKKYLSLLVRQTNMRLASLSEHQNEYTIELSIADFLFVDNPLENQVNPSTNKITANDALQYTQVWRNSRSDNNHYDYIIFFTGYELESDYGNENTAYQIKGRATVGSMCRTDGTSITVLTLTGGFQSVYILAHEVGHSLGADHDGEGEDIECRSADRYIMSVSYSGASTENKANPWHFSTCSEYSIGKYIRSSLASIFRRSCFKGSFQAAAEYVESKGNVAGQIYSANQQCQMLQGDSSRVCLGDEFSNIDNICTSMYCLEANSNDKCIEYFAAEGTLCGSGKWCEMGNCTASPDAPQIPEDYCFSDVVGTIGDKYTCAEYTKLYPFVCYDETVATACCMSCARVRKSSEFCPYGDKKVGCEKEYCETIDADGERYESGCCGTCNYDQILPCLDVKVVDGVSCQTRVNKDSYQHCYNSTVAYKCCATCASKRQSVKGCEYGDKDLLCRSSLLRNKDECSDSRFKRSCCKSCLSVNDLGAASNLILNTTLLGCSLLVFIFSVDAYS